MRLKKITAALCAASLLLSGCTRIPNKEIPQTETLAETSEPAEEAASPESSEQREMPDESVFASMDPVEASIYRLICEAPADIDEVILKSSMSHIDVTTALTDLEIIGLITRRMDGKYERL